MSPKYIKLILLMAVGGLILTIPLLADTQSISPFFLKRITHATSLKRDSEEPDISLDGKVIAFRSDSELLNQEIERHQREIWTYNTETKTISRITHSSDITRRSGMPSINEDGSKIAFISDTDFNDEGIPLEQYEVWLYDKDADDEFLRITYSLPIARANSAPSINQDGTKVVFESDFDFHGEGIPEDQTEIWLYDTTIITPTLRLTRITNSGALHTSESPRISGDGTKIVFESDANLTNDPGIMGKNEIWLYDTTTDAFTRVTTASTSSRKSLDPDISADGSKIVFESNSGFPLADPDDPDPGKEVWLYDVASGEVEQRITFSLPGTESEDPKINADGTRIVFRGDADLLGQGVPEGQVEIWLYDVSLNDLTRLTWSNHPAQDSEWARISGDGYGITFSSEADLLNDGTIPDKQNEIWYSSKLNVTDQVFMPVVVKN